LQKLPILIIHAVPPKSMGGVKRFADELIKGMNSLGIEVHTQFGKQDKSILGNLIKTWSEYVKSLQGVDLVHFIVLSPYDIPFIILAKIFGKKIVSTYHGIYQEESSLMKEPNIFIPFLISDMVYRKCSNVIVSPNSYLLQKLKILTKNEVIPNPFNSQISNHRSNIDVKQSKEEILLITASNFDIKKKSNALQHLLDAMNLVEKKYEHARLLVFGDGINLKNLKAKYAEKKNITFMGFRQDFRNFLLESDAYVHISGLDVQPYSVIEAMMLGKVILYNDIGSLVEMVDPSNNYVVSLDAESIAKGVFSLIDEIQNRNESFKEKSDKNRRFAIERYSTDVIATKYLALYRKTLAKALKVKTNL
jgi:glycosyltransferase involved in cell wall biosynthesis